MKEQDAGGRVDSAMIEVEAGAKRGREQGGEQFDKTIKAEGEECGAMRAGSREERDGTLDQHPGQGDGLEEDEAVSGPEASDRWSRRR